MFLSVPESISIFALSFSLYPTPKLRTNSLNTLWVIGARGS